MGWLSTGLGLVGGAIGGYFGGPSGAGIGSSIGSGIGEFFTGSDSGSGLGTSEFSNLLGGASSALGFYNSATGRGIKDQKELMKYQAELQDYYWTKQYGQRHQLEVNDLRSAGLNPILSAHSAGSVGGVSASASPAETRSQRLLTAVQANSALAQIQMMRSQAMKNNQELHLMGSQIYKNNTEASLMDRYQRMNELETLARIRMLDAQTKNLNDPFIKYASSAQALSSVIGSINPLKIRGFGMHLPWSRARDRYVDSRTGEVLN